MIPRKAVNLLVSKVKLAPDQAASVTTCGAHLVRVEAGPMRLTSKTVDAAYPDTTRIKVRAAPSGEISIPDAVRWLKDAPPSKQRYRCRTEIASDRIVIHSYYEDEFTLEMPPIVKGDFKAFVLNLGYLADVVKALRIAGIERVTLHQDAPTGPVAFRSGEVECLVMPMRK